MVYMVSMIIYGAHGIHGMSLRNITGKGPLDAKYYMEHMECHLVCQAAFYVFYDHLWSRW